MHLLPRLVQTHLRSHLPGRTRVTLALAARSPALQHVPVVVDGARPLFLDLRDASNHDLFRNSPHAKAPWQQATDAVLQRVLRPGDTVFDVGANRGLYSVSMAATVGASGRVVCFEPNPALLPGLRHTVSATPWMTLVPVALSDEDGSATLFVGENHEMGSLADWTLERSGAETMHVDVPVARLDTLLAAGAVPRPSVIKIDVEGNELKVLRGATALLDCEDAPILVYESNVYAAVKATGQPASAATAFLMDLARPGYRCMFVWHWGLLTRLQRGQLVHGDILAVPASRLDCLPSLGSQDMLELT
jgi:FkbM family methyltransferase